MRAQAVVTGWRYWKAIREVDLDAGLAEFSLGAPLGLDGAAATDDEWHDAGPRSAMCRALTLAGLPQNTHEAPDERCECGYRLVARLPDLCRYLTRTLAKLDALAVAGAIDAETRRQRIAIGRVEGTGTCLPGCRIEGDPPGTFRAATLRLVGPLLLSPNCYSSVYAPQASNWAAGFAESFGVPVLAAQHNQSNSHWLAALMRQESTV